MSAAPAARASRLFIHTVLHAERRLFGQQLVEFVHRQPWWGNEAVRALFEIDLVNRPYVYSNTPLDELDYPFQELSVLDRGARGYRVSVDERWLAALHDSVRREATASAGTTYLVDHKRLQYPFMARQSLDHNGNYCHGMIEKIENIVPIWRQG